MRISIVVSLLILAIGAALGWQDHQQLAAMRESCVQLRSKADRLGVITGPADATRVTRRSREDRDAAAGVAASRLIALEKEMDALPEGDSRREKLRIESRRLRMSMDATRLKALIAMVRADAELSQELRERLIFGALTDLSVDQPKSALGILGDTPTLLSETSEYVIASALGRWARQDPWGAIEWFRKNKESFPNSSPESKILAGTATHDPKLAFQLIEELGLKNDSATIRSIIGTAGSPEEKTAVLNALRGHVATLDDESSRNETLRTALRELSADLVKEGFQAATQWISSADLSPTELGVMMERLKSSVKFSETARWIEWIDRSPLAEKSDAVRGMVSRWAETDYKAAGEWLATAPPGETRNVSIRAYAQAISRYEPEVAATWAMTLPDGKDRQQTLKSIHANWQEKDPGAAEAFKLEHGLK